LGIGINCLKTNSAPKNILLKLILKTSFSNDLLFLFEQRIRGTLVKDLQKKTAPI
jgi:hypothetical protein